MIRASQNIVDPHMSLKVLESQLSIKLKIFAASFDGEC
jgi:hypothetical protein